MKTKRLWQIDLLRGLAVVGMVVYHFFFDLFFFTHTSLDPFSGPLFFLARLIAVTFLGLVGFSFYLSQQRIPDQPKLFLFVLKRSLLIFLAAVLVSLTTFLVDPTLTVRFGILHLISVSLLLLLPLSLIQSSLLIGTIATLSLISPWRPFSGAAFDYYPIFPWFGIILAGYLLARLAPPLPASRPPSLFSPILYLGRHSLLVYLIHQPLLFLLLGSLNVN